MTVALCTNCGNLKFGALLPCKDCGCGCSGNMDLDIAFTDHHVTDETLRGFGRVIQHLGKNTDDEAVRFWAFMKYVSDHYPEIIFADIPRKYRQAVASLLSQTELPEIMIEDSPRLDTVESSSPEAKYLSRVRHRQIECESCGHTQSFAVWSRINGSVDPSVKAMIASGRLFVNHCRSCGHQQSIVYETLYLDIEKPFALWLRNSDCRPDLRIHIPSHEYFGELSSDFTFRVVLSPVQLAEKIKVFADGHDDVLVEFVKLCLSLQRGIDLLHPMYYAETKKKLLSGDTMTFILLGSSPPEEIEYPLGSQKAEVSEILAKLQPTLSVLQTEWLSVDRDFVIRMLETSGLMRRIDI